MVNKDRQKLPGAMAAAFTLTEMLVVLVIIGLLAAIVGPRLFTRLDDAKQRTTMLQITNLAAAVDLFRIDMERLPTQEEGLSALVTAPADATNWVGPYLARDRLPKDAWGREYVYELDAASGRYVVVSYGADGRANGEGAARDLRSNEGDAPSAVAAAPASNAP
jgi:general secretion pathway protein G